MADHATVQTRLARYRAELERLAAELATIGFVSPGSLVQRYTSCGKDGCRCQADPPELHGPYWQWSRAEGGKTITRRVRDEEVPLYKEWIANRRHLREVVAQMEAVSQRATGLLLAQSPPRSRR
jgi:hypothetical protein